MIRRMMKRDEGERGVALIEFSLVFVFLLMLALGAFEYGMVFRDWLSVTIASREGGRVAASAADYGQADCVVLEATAGALQSFHTGIVTRVDIYKSDNRGAYAVGGKRDSYRPLLASDNPASLSLVACGSSQWVVLNANWAPNTRINTTGSADWIGVRVTFDHDWITNFLWWSGTVTFSDDAVFRLEPPAPTTTAGP
jgi:TadE-like protein